MSSCTDDLSLNHRPIIIAKRTDVNYSNIPLRPCMCSYFYDGFGRKGQNFIDSCIKYNLGDTIQ